MSQAPSELVGEIEDLWDQVWDKLETLGGNEPERGFKVKDIHAHLGRWDLVTALAITAHVEDRPTEDWDACFDGYTRCNARWSRQDIDLSTEEALVRCKGSHGRLVMTLRGLNNEDWDSYVLALAKDVRDHYKAHVDAPLQFATT